MCNLLWPKLFESTRRKYDLKSVFHKSLRLIVCSVHINKKEVYFGLEGAQVSLRPLKRTGNKAWFTMYRHQQRKFKNTTIHKSQRMLLSKQKNITDPSYWFAFRSSYLQRLRDSLEAVCAVDAGGDMSGSPRGFELVNVLFHKPLPFSQAASDSAVLLSWISLGTTKSILWRFRFSFPA